MAGGSGRPSASIVISTYNRADSLRRTLRALEHLDHPSFEVVVVDGPSTDGTGSVLAEYAGRIKVGRCPERNLSMSRNIGIALAAGEAVAFIDDDAYPDPAWLDELVAGLWSGEDVAAAGGPVFDHTGAELQAHSSLANRLGEVWTSWGPNPTDWLASPYSARYVYPMGTNAGFRRDRLVEIGGFDEEYEYYLDDTDIAVRMVEAGYLVKALDAGFVYHKFLPSPTRNERRAVINRFPVLKNRWYFALRHGAGVFSEAEIRQDLDGFVQHHRTDVEHHREHGALADHDLGQFERDAARAETAAREAAAALPRTRPAEWFADRQTAFMAFPTRRQAADKLHVCLVTQEYLPSQLNGIARVLHTLGTELGAMGHVVRIITEADEGSHATVDLEGDVWVHRIRAEAKPAPADLAVPRELWRFPAAVLDEVRRIDGMRPVDIVQVPNWGSEGAAVIYAGGFRTVLGLYTPFLTVAELDHRILADHPHHGALAQLERDGYLTATALLACGPSIVSEIQGRYGIDLDPTRIGFVPHGLPDLAPDGVDRSPDGSPDEPVILFVGRLEPRKGIDTFLAALPDVLRRFPGARVVAAGKDDIPGPRGTPYAPQFLGDPSHADIRDRVSFLGVVDDEHLARLYAACDVFVAPSRYESFGLIAVEAMRAGKPVIASDVGGLSEIVVPGETGLLVPPGDVAALTAALVEVLTSDREAMGKAARLRFESRFDSRHMAKGIEAFYRRTVTRPVDQPPVVEAARAEGAVAGAVIELLACPACGHGLRPVVEAVCVDGRLKDGALACERCRCLAAEVADFRFDFHRAGLPWPPDPPSAQLRPVLGEWRLPPGGPGLLLEGSWTASGPYVVASGLPGDRLSFSVRGTDIVMRMARTPTSGRVAVIVDGRRTRTIDLFEAEGSWVVGVPVLANARDGLHTVELLAVGASSRGAGGTDVHVEEVIVKGPIAAGRPFVPAVPINRGNPYSPALEALLDELPAGTPVLEIGGGDRRRAVPGHVNFEYLPFELADMYGDIHHLPFRDGAFELVCSQAVFEHVSRPFAAAHELLRVTRPGGLIFTEVAFLQPVHAAPHHYFNMTTAGVRELFADCEVVDEGWFGPLSLTVDWMLRAAGLEGKVPKAKLERIVAGVRRLDPLVEHDDLQAVASGVHLTVRTSAP